MNIFPNLQDFLNKRDEYVNTIYRNNKHDDEVLDLVLDGLRASKRMKLNNNTTTSTSTTIIQNDKENSSSSSKLTNNQQDKESIYQIKDQNQVTKDHREVDNDHDDNTPYEVDYLRVISGK